MRRVSQIGAAFAALAATACATPSRVETAYLHNFTEAGSAALPFAPITDTDPGIAIPEAYRLQRRLVAAQMARGDRIAGYKGGLMSAESLRARYVTEPLVGVLFASGKVASNGTVSLCGYRKGSFEMKLGFIFAHGLAKARRDEAALRAAVGSVVPVVDLPDIAYRDPEHYSAVDMVAANISAAKFVLGTPRPAEPIDLDGLPVAIEQDGHPITSGRGDQSLGSQWSSLMTVVRQIEASGRRIKAGDMVLTGKIGERGWLPPGAYRADYGALGTVSFTVTLCPA